MARNAATDRSALYVRSVRTRVTEKVYQRLEEMVKQGDCHTVGEAARRILSGDKIAIYYVDNSLHMPMQRLSAIRSELRSIGVNINQITRYFHADAGLDAKMVHANAALSQYKQVDARVEELLIIVKELAKKWLQK